MFSSLALPPIGSIFAKLINYQIPSWEFLEEVCLGLSNHHTALGSSSHALACTKPAKLKSQSHHRDAFARVKIILKHRCIGSIPTFCDDMPSSCPNSSKVIFLVPRRNLAFMSLIISISRNSAHAKYQELWLNLQYLGIIDDPFLRLRFIAISKSRLSEFLNGGVTVFCPPTSSLQSRASRGGGRLPRQPSSAIFNWRRFFSVLYSLRLPIAVHLPEKSSCVSNINILPFSDWKFRIPPYTDFQGCCHRCTQTRTSSSSANFLICEHVSTTRYWSRWTDYPRCLTRRLGALKDIWSICRKSLAFPLPNAKYPSERSHTPCIWTRDAPLYEGANIRRKCRAQNHLGAKFSSFRRSFTSSKTPVCQVSVFNVKPRGPMLPPTRGEPVHSDSLPLTHL